MVFLQSVFSDDTVNYFSLRTYLKYHTCMVSFQYVFSSDTINDHWQLKPGHKYYICMASSDAVVIYSH